MKKTHEKLTKIWHHLPSFITTLGDGVNCKFIQLLYYKNSCGCIPGYQEGKGVHSGTGLKLTQINFVILTVYKICRNKKTLFFRDLRTKFGNSCIGIFQTRKNTISKTTSVGKFYTFQSLLKNVTLLVLPADSSADSSIKNNLWRLEFKIFFFGKIEFSNFKKTPFRYVFSIVIMYSRETARVKVLLSKGCMVAVRNYSTNTIMEKKNRGRGGQS